MNERRMTCINDCTRSECCVLIRITMGGGGRGGLCCYGYPIKRSFQKRNETSLDMDTDRTMDVTRFNIQRTSQENVNYLYIIQSVL